MKVIKKIEAFLEEYYETFQRWVNEVAHVNKRKEKPYEDRKENRSVPGRILRNLSALSERSRPYEQKKGEAQWKS